MKLYIFIPTLRGVSPTTYLALEKALYYAAEKLPEFNYYLSFISNESLISRARNSAFSEFLTTDSDFYFSIDDDIGFPEDTIYKLITANKPIMAGAYPTKNFPTRHVVRPRIVNNNFVTNGDLLELEYASSGCLMVKREVGEKLQKKFPELAYNNNSDLDENYAGKTEWAFFMPMIQNQTVHTQFKEYLSEDWAFCHRARLCDCDIWLDTSLRLSHTGPYKFEGFSGQELVDNLKKSFEESFGR